VGQGVGISKGIKKMEKKKREKGGAREGYNSKGGSCAKNLMGVCLKIRLSQKKKGRDSEVGGERIHGGGT